jgi:hypothetical protein
MNWCSNFFGCYEQDTNEDLDLGANDGDGSLAKVKPRASIMKMAKTIPRR